MLPSFRMETNWNECGEHAHASSVPGALVESQEAKKANMEREQQVSPREF